MSNLKVGMRVVAVTDYPENSYYKRITCGDFGTVTGSIDHLIEVKFDGKGSESIYPWRVEPVTEEPKQMFNIKTDPWFIRVNSKQEFEVIQDWLQENYGTCLSSNYYSSMVYLTNSYADGGVREDFVMHGSSDPLEKQALKEIKLTFKTTIDSVTFPEVETEQQIKMKQLQETIDKAAKQIKELKEGK